ncbi:hypothetical protein LguiB_007493 [Lonicera macranthoides]
MGCFLLINIVSSPITISCSFVSLVNLQKETWRNTIILSFQSLGVVYGRLSTTPLYVFGAILPADIESHECVHELFSFVLWTLTIKFAFVCVVYPALVLCFAGQAAYISKHLGASVDYYNLSDSIPNGTIGVTIGFRGILRIRNATDIKNVTAEGRMIVVGSPNKYGNGLIPLTETNESHAWSSTLAKSEMSTLGGSIESVCCDSDGGAGGGGATPVRKKIRFVLLSPNNPKMRVCVRQELQELVDQSGTAYFVGQSHLSARDSANFVKQFPVRTYVFLDKNCREPPVELNIPHAALLEVCMVYVM